MVLHPIEHIKMMHPHLWPEFKQALEKNMFHFLTKEVAYFEEPT